jgi:hypothetical protein
MGRALGGRHSHDMPERTLFMRDFAAKLAL